MAATYNLISSQLLGSSAASVTFSSIPQTYTDLVLRYSARTDRAGNAVDNFALTINADSSTNYSCTQLYGSGSTTTSNNIANSTVASFSFGLDGNGATSNTFASGEIYIPNYTASQSKPLSTFSAMENNATAAYINATAQLWRNTAAITSLSATMQIGTNFLTGSSFYLYGIRNS